MRSTLKSSRLAICACCLSVSLMPASVPANQPPAPPPALAEILNKGNAAFDAARYHESLEAYLEADRLYPDQAKVKVSLATAHAELGNSKEGLEALERAIALEPERLRDAEAIRDLRRRLESLAATDRAPAAGLDPAVLLELKVAAREARLAIEQASKLDDPFKRADEFTRAREILLPILSRLDFESIEAWVTAALIAIDEEARDWAALAYEAITRLDPEGCLEEPLITVVAQLRTLGAAESAASVREARGRLVAAASAPVISEESAISLARAFALGEGVPCNPVLAREWVLRVSPAKHQEVVDSICAALFEQADERFVAIYNRRDPAPQHPITVEDARFGVDSGILAHAYALSGDLPAAGEAATSGVSSNRESETARIMATLAKAEAERGGRAGAERLLKAYGDLLNDRTPKLPLVDLVEAQSAVAIGWSWLGRHDVAKTWSDTAYTNALKVGAENRKRARALAEVAFAFAIGNDHDKAALYAREAEQQVSLHQEEYDLDRELAKQRLAQAFAYIGDVQSSLRLERSSAGILASAPNALEGIVKSRNVMAVHEVLDAIRESGEYYWSDQPDRGKGAGQTFSDGGRRTVAASTATLGDLQEGLRLAMEIQSSDSRADALYQIALLYRLIGEHATSRATWSLAERSEASSKRSHTKRFFDGKVDSAWPYAHAARVARTVRGLAPAPLIPADWFGFWW